MKIRALLLIIILASVTAYVNADEGSRNYIVIKGDTLWDISDSELNEPMLWPRLWNVNPQIENPDLIYPGTRVWVPTKEELMRLTKDMPAPEGMVTPEDMPVVEELELDFPEYKPVVKTPPEPPVEYLVDMRTFLSSGWVSRDHAGIGNVTFTDRGRNLFGNSDTVFLDSDEEISVGDMFLTTRMIKKIKHAGNQIRVTGLIKVIGIENNTPKAKIIEVFDHVDEGDSIIGFTGSMPPVKPEAARTPDINGYIIASRMDNLISNEGEIVYLDKGADDGLEAGDIFSIQDNAPTGTLQVITTKTHTAAAIILKTREEVMVGDTFGKK